MRDMLNNGLTILVDNDPVLELDVVEQIAFSSQSVAVSYPIEKGASIVQRGYNKPSRITVKGYIADSVLGSEDDENDRDIKAFQLLRAIKNDLTVVDLMDPDEVFESYVITSLDKVQTPNNRGVLEVEITFDEIKFGSKVFVDVPMSIIAKPSGAQKGATTEKDSGEKDGEEKEPKSLLASGADSVSGFAGKLFGGK